MQGEDIGLLGFHDFEVQLRRKLDSLFLDNGFGVGHKALPEGFVLGALGINGFEGFLEFGWIIHMQFVRDLYGFLDTDISNGGK